MKTSYSHFVGHILIILIIPLIITACNTPGLVISYPPIPELVTSDVYTITVNDQEVWTEKLKTNMDIGALPEWFTSTPYTSVQQEVHIVNFSAAGEIEVNIHVPETVNRAMIHPTSRGIVPSIQGNILSFTLRGPDKLYIEVNDLPPVCFFANPMEKSIPVPEDPDVRYFGPGVHRPGMMNLGNNEVVYIAGGAIVYGGIRTNGSSHVKILGRGILDGDFEHQRMVVPENSDQVEFNGIIIRNGRSWTNTIVNCTNVRYENVKVISFGPGGDGINPLGSRHVVINDCFLRCSDDCIAIKSPDSTLVVEDVMVTNNTMIGYAFSDGITIGFETNGPHISHVKVSNCDILMARGGSRVDGHSAFSIICDGPAVISDIFYEDIRVEEPVLKLFELNITDGTKYGINPPGHIRNIHLKNIAWTSERPIILNGFDADHRVGNVLFENCTIKGESLKSTDHPVFQINEFVDDVRFK
ncbi:MAG: hypothetical protein KFF73_01930 [Cyclobacteriaceae bacterium]|nr:hypothetical protein [Cyclobacteriaceae bacterium]